MSRFKLHRQNALSPQAHAPQRLPEQAGRTTGEERKGQISPH